MAERKKGPREVRLQPFELSPLISEGADLSSVQGFTSREVTLSAQLTAAVNPEDTSILLNANPGVGAQLVIEPGSLTAEETFKVLSVAGASSPFTVGIIPSAEQGHSPGATVDYEPGVNANVLVDDTPAVTPGITLVNFLVKEGADGNTYRLNVLGTCDNGEVVEDEVEIDVVEFTPTTTVTKQPGETRDVAVDFAEYTMAFGTTLTSAVAFVSRSSTANTTLSSGASAGASTLVLVANPGVGALLTVNPGGPNQEKLYVSSVTVSGTTTATVSPLQFTHSGAENVTYQPGLNTRLLVSATATITGTEAIFRVRRGAAGQGYRLAVFGTLADGQVVQKTITLDMPEL